MTITVYTTVSCPFCLMLKDYLKERGVSFVEKLIDEDDSARSEMVNLSNGFLGVPFTFIIRDNGIKETVVGFDKGKLDKILQISTNNPINTNAR